MQPTQLHWQTQQLTQRLLMHLVLLEQLQLEQSLASGSSIWKNDSRTGQQRQRCRAIYTESNDVPWKVPR